MRHGVAGSLWIGVGWELGAGAILLAASTTSESGDSVALAWKAVPINFARVSRVVAVGVQRTGSAHPIHCWATVRTGSVSAPAQLARPFFTDAAPRILMGWRLARSAASIAEAKSFMLVRLIFAMSA